MYLARVTGPFSVICLPLEESNDENHRHLCRVKDAAVSQNIRSAAIGVSGLTFQGLWKKFP
jgi:hypothetical protein